MWNKKETVIEDWTTRQEMELLFAKKEKYSAFFKFHIQVPVFPWNHLLLSSLVSSVYICIFIEIVHDKSIYMTLNVIILLSLLLKSTLQLTNTLDKCERKGGAFAESIFLDTLKRNWRTNRCLFITQPTSNLSLRIQIPLSSKNLL